MTVAEADPDTSLDARAKDLPALLQVVADAAKVGSGLWLSYIFLLFFLLVAVGGVTHRDLFLENPVALPFLSVNLPLVAFFLVGPALFIVAHTYVLLHFVLLADKARTFHVQLQVQVSNATTRTRLRRQLPSDIFAQALAGPRDIRDGTIGTLLMLIAWISLAIGPVLLLLLFQLQFLAYHSGIATWWHRIAIVIDLLVLWRLWPSILRGRIAAPSRPQLKRAWLPMMVSIACVLFAFTVASYPGEVLNRLPSIAQVGFECSPQRMTWVSVHDLVVGEGCGGGRTPRSLWPNRIVLTNFEPPRRPSDGTSSGASGPAQLDLSNRNLDGIVIIGGNLRKANFTSASLRGARLIEVQMQGANLTTADLAGAALFQVMLQEAVLSGARMQGASLAVTNLAGAMLSGTRLQGAALDNANLRGASVFAVHLEGASLQNARLEGTLFAGSFMQGARLNRATLDGALVQATQLQGASLDGTSLHAVDLSGTFLWRGHGNIDSFREPFVIGRVEFQPAYLKSTQQGLSESMPWSAEAYRSLRQMLETEMPSGTLKDAALERIRILECTKDPCDASKKILPELKDELRRAEVVEGFYLEALIVRLGDVICGAPDIEGLTGMVRNGRIVTTVRKSTDLVDRILGPTCPVGKLLTAAQKAELEALGASAGR